MRFISFQGHCLRCIPFLKKKKEEDLSTECKIFVKGFGADWTHQTLFERFSVCGEVLSQKCAMDYGNNVNKGYGVVAFGSKEAAAKAITELDGAEAGDEKTLIVSKYEPRQEKDKFTNLFVRGFVFAADLTPEQKKKELTVKFEEFGTVTSVDVQDRLRKDTVASTFCFVNFAEHQSALAAIEAYSANESVRVTPFQNKAEREREQQRKLVSLKKSKVPFTLYVSNISPFTTT